jgi:hypothetical protein
MDENHQILECDFAFKCPQHWDNLTALDHPDRRYRFSQVDTPAVIYAKREVPNLSGINIMNLTDRQTRFTELSQRFNGIQECL